MEQICDDGINELYAIAWTMSGEMPDETRKEAVRRLKRIALQGNEEAGKALDRLANAPRLDPMLREIIRA
jgi:hypothetical protein